MRRAAWLALALLSPCLCAAEPPASKRYVFPRPFEVFRPLLADPRQVELSARYYRFKGDDLSDVALGHSWGLARWQDKKAVPAVLQADIEAVAYSRFQLSGDVNKFQIIDFHVDLPLEARRGVWSGKLMLFHESSHLGDDYIRDTRDLGFRYSMDGLRLLLSYDAGPLVRFYSGGAYELHAVPRPAGGRLQGGFEIKTPYLGWCAQNPCRLYLAQDLQARARTAWNLTSRTAAGLAVSAREGSRALRLFAAYQDGHSAYGQFYTRREHQLEFGLTLGL